MYQKQQQSKQEKQKQLKQTWLLIYSHGYEAQVRPRSGKSLKTKLRVALGTIDQTYNKRNRYYHRQYR